ncbi:MAG: lysylphosphatidylglycerol synthase domain-containing protein, partial [Haloferacaceae archaeon]
MPAPDSPDDARDRRLRAASVVAAACFLLAPFLVADPRGVLAALEGTTTPRLALAVALVALASGLWGVGLAVVLAAVGRRVPLRRAVPLFVATAFLNNVTPFGQVGGDPVSGALVAASEGVAYEVGLAGIAALNALNRVAAVALGVVGAAVLLSRGVAVAGLGRTAAVAAAATVVVAAAVVTLFAWRVPATPAGETDRSPTGRLDAGWL